MAVVNKFKRWNLAGAAVNGETATRPERTALIEPS